MALGLSVFQVWCIIKSYMRNNASLAILILALLTAEAGRAGTLTSSTAAGSTSFSQSLSADGDFETSKDESNEDFLGEENEEEAPPPWSWNFAYSLLKSTTIDPTSGNDITDTTNDFSGGLGWDFGDIWGLSGGYRFTSTPSENLTSRGPNLYVSLSWPKFSVRAGAELQRYDQQFSTSGRRSGVVRSGVGVNMINQTAFNLRAKYKAFDWARIGVTYTKYTYDKDINTFLAALDSPRAIQTGAAGFSTTLQGFSSDSKGLTLYFYPGDDWELDLGGTSSTNASDGSIATSLKSAAYYDLSKVWRLGAGYEIANSPTLSDHIYSLTIEFNWL